MNLGLPEYEARVLRSTGTFHTTIQSCDLISILPKLSSAQQNSMDQQLGRNLLQYAPNFTTVHFYEANELNDSSNQ